MLTFVIKMISVSTFQTNLQHTWLYPHFRWHDLIDTIQRLKMNWTCLTMVPTDIQEMIVRIKEVTKGVWLSTCSEMEKSWKYTFPDSFEHEDRTKFPVYFQQISQISWSLVKPNFFTWERRSRWWLFTHGEDLECLQPGGRGRIIFPGGPWRAKEISKTDA